MKHDYYQQRENQTKDKHFSNDLHTEKKSIPGSAPLTFSVSHRCKLQDSD